MGIRPTSTYEKHTLLRIGLTKCTVFFLIQYKYLLLNIASLSLFVYLIYL